MLPYGIAGPRTLSALGIADSDALPSAIPAVSVEVVSQMFPVTPIGNIAGNLPPLLSALIANQVADKPMVLMALSTVRAEVECFEPISEGQSGSTRRHRAIHLTSTTTARIWVIRGRPTARSSKAEDSSSSPGARTTRRTDRNSSRPS